MLSGGARSHSIVLSAAVHSLGVIEVVESTAFRHWICALRDRGAVAQFNARLRSLSLVMRVGNGVNGSRVHHGPGCRVCFPREDGTAVMLCGGGKNSQQRDIECAGFGPDMPVTEV